MSKISQIFDALKSAIVAELSDYQQIPDPFLGEETASCILAKGFSIAMGPGSPANRNGATCDFRLNRAVQVQLTRRIENTQNEVTAYEATVKAMFEDQYLLLKHFAGDVTLGGVANDIDYVGDNGLVEFPTTDNLGRHLDLTTTFEIQYYENLNS